MKFLLAKTRGRNSQLFKVMASNDDLLVIPDLSSSVDYSAEYKLEEDEWFKLENFSDLGYENVLIENPFNSTEFNQILANTYSKIDYFCFKNDHIFLFQKMSSSQLLRKKWFEISDAPTLETDKPIIVLNDFVDAVYNQTDDVLYFKDIARIKPMFRGIGELYREATQDEVDAFLEHDFISLADGYTSLHIKTANRKRIAIAMDTFNGFSDDEKQQIFEYTRIYCDDIQCIATSFVVGTEEQLKKVLYGIEQRYFMTPLGHEKRLANSILRLDN